MVHDDCDESIGKRSRPQCNGQICRFRKALLSMYNYFRSNASNYECFKGPGTLNEVNNGRQVIRCPSGVQKFSLHSVKDLCLRSYECECGLFSE